MDREKLRRLFDLTGRVVIVTGGTRGIGRALAEGYVAAGAKVVVASRKPEACKQTEQHLQALGGAALGVPTHLGELGALRTLVQRTVDAFGGVDVVVNNAANALALPLDEYTAEAWAKSLDVNLRGPVFLVQEALPYLKRSRHACVLNVLSGAAFLFSSTVSLWPEKGVAMSSQHRQEISCRLRPVRSPRVLDGVLGKDQLEAVLDLIRRHGPWDLILKHHFSSLEELVATSSGGPPLDPDASLDSFLTPTFRGFFANGGVCLYPEAEPIFYERRFMAWAREFWGARYCQPMKILFNVNGPAWNFDPGHLDSPRFRGMGLVNTPTWLLSVMGKSGLFQAWAIRMAEVIVWFQKDTESGGFTYWPDGPLAPPKRLSPPLWNRGVVTQNTHMYHRGESNGPTEERANPKGLAFDSTFSGDPNDPDRWQIRTGDTVIARYTTDQLRLLVHWDAELYTDLADLKMHVDHLDDLTPNRVFETFVQDLRAKGVSFEMPSEPMRDRAFIELLAKTYDVGPSSYPAEAPVATHALAKGPERLQDEAVLDALA